MYFSHQKGSFSFIYIYSILAQMLHLETILLNRRNLDSGSRFIGAIENQPESPFSYSFAGCDRHALSEIIVIELLLLLPRLLVHPLLCLIRTFSSFLLKQRRFRGGESDFYTVELSPNGTLATQPGCVTVASESLLYINSDPHMLPAAEGLCQHSAQCMNTNRTCWTLYLFIYWLIYLFIYLFGALLEACPHIYCKMFL